MHHRAVFATPDALAAALVEQTLATAADAVSKRGRFTVALTGGSAASTLYPVLAKAVLPWDKVHVFFGDERSVDKSHADSNFKLAHDTFMSLAPIPEGNIHRMRGEDPADVAAKAYEAELLRVTDGTGALDVVHVGMGPDGHICSLFPGHALLRDDVRLVAPILDSPKPPPSRLTLTMQALSRAREVWFLVSGASTADAVKSVFFDADCALPAAIAARRGATVRGLMDNDAAKHLK